MDSLKLDRFRKLLNRQNTTINSTDTHSTSTTAGTIASSSLSSIATSTTKPSKPAGDVASKITISETRAISESIPRYVTKDNPTPAVFIARKLFSDFIELASNKIETILSLEPASRDKPIFKPLRHGQDLIYDQVLEGLGSISEFCLPSALRLLLSWYHHQLDTDDGLNSSSVNNSCHQKPSLSLDNTFQQQQHQQQHQHDPLSINDQDLGLPDCCGSPSCQLDNQFLTQQNSLSQPARSPASPSPDMSNQPSNTSSLPLDHQLQSSLATISMPLHVTSPVQQSNDNQFQSNSGTANTSNSTATNASSNSITLDDSTNTTKRLEFSQARCLLIEYTFCQALIEIFSKLYLHPGHEDLIVQVEEIAFQHFKYSDNEREQQLNGVESEDLQRLADKYAEVVGVLAKTRFEMVRKRFISELNALRVKEMTTYNIQCIVTLLSGLKFFRVKMAPIEEFEASFQLLQELADYFVEVRQKSIRHALAELFAGIMLPLASTVKNEVKIPCLKNFVDSLWTATLDMCTRKKHSPTLFPLVTCLLCLSQRALFLQNWSPFLSMCQSGLKGRDQKMCRIAFESLYRLIWMYMIRVKCESNNVTQNRLNSIVDSLFPKGSRQIVPRDSPLGPFVDIIQFIAQERLDFAIRHIIFELLSVDRSIKVVTAPERMNIGLQAYLAIADSLQQKESDPAMPIQIGATSTGHNHHFDHNNNGVPHAIGSRGCGPPYSHHRMLSDDVVKSIGLHPYHSHVQRSFNDILKALDAQFGKPLMLTNFPNTTKDLDDVISPDRKPKVELFRTCLAAIPRLMPDGMTKAELIDLLARMTIHVDEEMRRNAFESLQILVTEFQDWRLDAIEGYTLFLANQIDESLKYLVDSTLKMLLQLLISWRILITSSPSSYSCPSSAPHPEAAGASTATSNGNLSIRTTTISIQTGYETISSRTSGCAGGQIAARKNRALAEMRLIQSELSNTRFDRLVNVIQKVEGASLVMLCSCHHQTRKLASHLLRECRSILRCYSWWTCMEQIGFKSPDDVDCGDGDDLSASLKGSLSADNLSRITTTSANGPAHSSVMSMNTQAVLSTSVSKMCISGHSSSQQQAINGIGSGSGGSNQAGSSVQQQQHDLYDEDIENNLGDCYSSDDNSTLILWIAVMMLESDKEHEYVFALRLLKKILPNMPFEQQDFVDELDRNLSLMGWQDSFPGIHALVLKGCVSAATYDLCISLLDHMTPILKHRICTPNERTENCLPLHVFILATYLLSTYEDPGSYSLNIARRLALCCEENSQKLENLSAVMTLYSRRSFSKDAFQWIKCVAKYLNDACPRVVPNAIPLLIGLLETGPANIQRLILPIVYCILTYIDINLQPSANFNADLLRIYNKCLGTTPPAPHSCQRSQVASHQQQQQPTPPMWHDAKQIFKLIISKSSSLTASSSSAASTGLGLTSPPSIHSSSAGLASGGRGALELPGRTMEFSLEVESLPVIGKSRLIELGASLVCTQQQQQSIC